VYKRQGLQEAMGALITDVVDNSPASQAKLRVGDVIIMLNNNAVKDANHLVKMVAETPINSQVTLKIHRDGKFQQVAVTVGKLADVISSGSEQPKNVDRMLGVDKASILGMDLANINDDLRRRFNLDRSQTGVLVVNIKRDSNAERAGIKAGDIIIRIAAEPVRSVVQLKGFLDKMRAEKKYSTNLLITRAEMKQFIAIQLVEDAPKAKQSTR
jgi:serine protease Do